MTRVANGDMYSFDYSHLDLSIFRASFSEQVFPPRIGSYPIATDFLAGLVLRFFYLVRKSA
jgi:hypothetical protein